MGTARRGQSRHPVRTWGAPSYEAIGSAEYAPRAGARPYAAFASPTQCEAQLARPRAIAAESVETAAATIGLRQAWRKGMPAIQPRTGRITTVITIASSASTWQSVRLQRLLHKARPASAAAIRPAPITHKIGQQGAKYSAPIPEPSAICQLNSSAAPHGLGQKKNQIPSKIADNAARAAAA